MGMGYDVCCGVDVGKYSHHMVALDASGEVLAEGPVRQSEAAIREALAPVAAAGRARVVVDQPGPLSSLLLAVAADMALDVGFITPRAMREGICLFGGEVKTDARDARVIAELSLRIPSLVRAVKGATEASEELSALLSFDREATERCRRAEARVHELLLRSCPALGELLGGQRVKRKLPLALLERYGGAVGLSEAGRDEVLRFARGLGRVGASVEPRVDEVFAAIGSQTVVPPGTRFTEELVRIEAAELRAALGARRVASARIGEVLAGLPEAEILMSMPGLGPVTCATFLAEVPDVGAFAGPSQLAAYAGLAPRVRQSGRSLNSTTRPRSGNRRLKRVLVLSAARSVDFCEESRAYYDRKRSEGRCHYSACMALARRRINVIYAMLRDGKRYGEQQEG